MALEHIAGLFLLGLLNIKVIKDWVFFELDSPKRIIEVGTGILIIFGVFYDFTTSFSNPYRFIPIFFMFETLPIVIALIFEYTLKVKTRSQHIGSIRSLDI